MGHEYDPRVGMPIRTVWQMLVNLTVSLLGDLGWPCPTTSWRRGYGGYRMAASNQVPVAIRLDHLSPATSILCPAYSRSHKIYLTSGTGVVLMMRAATERHLGVINGKRNIVMMADILRFVSVIDGHGITSTATYMLSVKTYRHR